LPCRHRPTNADAEPVDGVGQELVGERGVLRLGDLCGESREVHAVYLKWMSPLLPPVGADDEVVIT
jgi:hypothetical protein